MAINTPTSIKNKDGKWLDKGGKFTSKDEGALVFESQRKATEHRKAHEALKTATIVPAPEVAVKKAADAKEREAKKAAKEKATAAKAKKAPAVA